MAEANISLICNSEPIRLFIESLDRALEIRDRTINFYDLPLELVRVEQDFSTTSTGELFMTLYPSDAFINFASTVTGDLNFSVVK